jgi:hypothetical protein
MIKKYICFFKKNNEFKTLTFRIDHNALTDAWGSTIETALNKGHNQLEGLQNLFNPGATTKTITEPIANIIKILENYNPAFINSWPPKTDILTALNDLHYKFQLTQESGVPSLSISKEYDYNLNLLNAKIHEAEHVLMSPKKYAVWFVNQSLNNSIEVTDELRKYWGVTFIKYNPARTLYLGYHTIGKDLKTCFTDNDTEVVKTSSLRQQQYISTETVFRLDPVITINRNRAIKKWLSRNNLNSFVDLKDPKYKYNQQMPTLGRLDSKLSDSQITEIWKDWDFYKVDAE